MSNSIAISFSVDSDGLVNGLKLASQGTETAAQQMRLHLSGAGEGAKGLSDRLREFKTEATQASRVANFYARDLAEIIPGANGAGVALKSMIAALFSGGGLAAGFELVIGLGAALKSQFEEFAKAEEKAREEFTKFATEIDAGSKKAREAVESQLLSLRHATEAERFHHETVEPLLEKQREAKEALRRADEEVAALQAQTAADENDEIRRAKDLSDALKAQTKARQELGTVAGGAMRAMEQEAVLEAANRKELEKKTGDEILAIRASMGSKVQEVQAKLKADLHKIELEYAGDPDLGAKMRVAAEQKAADQIRLIRQHEAGLREEAVAKSNKAILDLNVHLADVAAEQERRQTKVAVEEAKKRAEEELATAKKIGDGIGAAFEGIIAGTESIGKAFEAMAKTAIKAVIDLAIKMIQADALVAAAEAAKSQAGIPIIGPVLAIAALGAMEGLIMGLLSSLPSAAGGWDVPTGVGSGGTLAMVHGGERVMPKDIADPMREFFANGGGAGGNHFHLHAAYIDGASVRKFIASREFRDAISDAQRNGLL